MSRTTAVVWGAAHDPPDVTSPDPLLAAGAAELLRPLLWVLDEPDEVLGELVEPAEA
ncbi:MAG TPA: hypothetical protein VMB74_03215 [Streptosporangiaceae bacterium]|nr:hypothetical protein [Streptosporangiaceae bacterium]